MKKLLMALTALTLVSSPVLAQDFHHNLRHEHFGVRHYGNDRIRTLGWGIGGVYDYDIPYEDYGFTPFVAISLGDEIVIRDEYGNRHNIYARDSQERTVYDASLGTSIRYHENGGFRYTTNEDRQFNVNHARMVRNQ